MTKHNNFRIGIVNKSEGRGVEKKEETKGEGGGGGEKEEDQEEPEEKGEGGEGGHLFDPGLNNITLLTVDLKMH